MGLPHSPGASCCPASRHPKRDALFGAVSPRAKTCQNHSRKPPRRLLALPFRHCQDLNHVRRYVHRRRLPINNRLMPAPFLALCNTARSRVTTRRLRRNGARKCCGFCRRKWRREGDGYKEANGENQAAHFGCGATPPIRATKTGRELPSVQIWRIWPKLATG